MGAVGSLRHLFSHLGLRQHGPTSRYEAVPMGFWLFIQVIPPLNPPTQSTFTMHSIIGHFLNKEADNLTRPFNNNSLHSVIGVMICLVNSFWTWNTARLSSRITARKIPESAIFPTMRRYCQISVVIALIGMFVTIISAEMIVGNLVSKTLLSSQVVGVVPVLSANGVAQNTLQALDIFLVQANTNALVSHFAPLVCYLFLQTQIPRQIRETTTLPVTVATTATDKNE